MIAFIIIAIILIYSFKTENHIETPDIRKKFEPFIEATTQRYLQNKINCSIEDVDTDKRCLVIHTEILTINEDKVSHFLYINGNNFLVESTYTIFDLKLTKTYNYKISEMNRETQIREAKNTLSDFFDHRMRFEKKMNQRLFMK